MDSGRPADPNDRTASDRRGDVVVDDVSKTYVVAGEARPAIADVDLTLAGGTFTSVLGPSGCGKSTLLRVLAGLLEPERGTVRIDGRGVAEMRRSGAIGFVPQAPALLPWATALDNVLALDRLRPGSARCTADAALDWLRRVGLDDDATSLLPHQLSGGMQHRVSLARAFSLEPSVLLMDEPFAALDELTRATVRDTLAELWTATGATVVFVTHSIEEAVLLGDRVVVLGGAPGRVRTSIDVTLERPRRQSVVDDPDFRAVTARVRSALTDGSTP